MMSRRRASLVLVSVLTLTAATAFGQEAADPVSPEATTPPAEDLSSPPRAPVDPLDEALALAGYTRASLGWSPKGWWSRWPRAVPYKLDHFDDLLADPLATITFTRTMGAAVREHLSQAGLEAEGARGSHSLYRLAYAVGIERKFGGFRDYSANLTVPPTPLADAVLELYHRAGRKTSFVTFGTDSPYPPLETDLRAAAEAVPESLRPILGQLVLETVECRRWVELAFRRVRLEDRVAAANRFDLGVETVDALEYPHECDDVAFAWDEASLWYGALRAVEALDQARRDLSGAVRELPADAAFTFDWETPHGWIRIRGTGDDEIAGDNTLLVVDLGGDDHYRGAIAGTKGTHPLSLCLDLGGDDHYEGGRRCQGAGVCGVGVLLDVRGDDHYEAESYAQGVGQFGFGGLFDLAGDDTYRVRWSGQGCGFFGVGLLAEGEGSDRYHLHADGQGFGGVSGVGTLADRAGDDVYFAEPDPAKSGRPSYHSEGTVSVSNAQGCSMGRRGDGADGHSWAGGLGALLDVEGDNSYTGGNWTLGTGYWFGTGIVYEGSGDDDYKGSVWSQASGAHFCIGALIDDGGDDWHQMHLTSRSGLSFAHDFTVSILMNTGGDDHYEMTGDGLAYAINRSYAFLIDIGGDDTYRGKEGDRPGIARPDPKYSDRDLTYTYFAEANSLALFLDAGGTDSYWGETPSDDKSWGDTSPGSENRRLKNPGIGLDTNSKNRKRLEAR